MDDAQQEPGGPGGTPATGAGGPSASGPAESSAAAPAPAGGGSGTSGWLIALGVVAVLVLGGLTAAVIHRGDSGTTANTTPADLTLNISHTTEVKQTTPQPTTVTVTPTVTVQQQVTVATPTTTVARPAATTTTP